MSSYSGPAFISLIFSVLRLLPALIIVISSFLYLTKFPGPAAGLMVSGSFVNILVGFGSIVQVFAGTVLHMSTANFRAIQNLLQFGGFIGASLFAIGLFLTVVNRVETAQ